MTNFPGADGGGTIATSGDVALNNPTNGDVLAYTNDTGKWTNSDALSHTVQTTGGGVENVVALGSVGSTATVSLASGNMASMRLTSSTCALSISGATSGKACSLTLMIQQDSNGGRSITWPNSVKWPNGTAPVLSSAAGSVDFISLLTVDGGTAWYGFLSGKGY